VNVVYVRTAFIALMALLLSALTALLLSQSAGASQTGVVQGTVRFEGSAPAPEMLEVTKNREVCGESVQARELVIAGGRVANAVASIEGLEADVGAREYLLSNTGCRFDPPVLAASAGGILIVDNQDDVLHNTHLNFVRGSATRTVGNWALSNKGARITADRPLRRAGEIDVECDAHPWMHATIKIFDHPYFGVTDGSGSFRVTDVPPGTHTLRLWHEVLGEREQQVTVEAGGTATVEFVFSTGDLAANGEGGR